MSRSFERILVEEINLYLERNSLISDSKLGFRHKKSVELQLLNCYTKWITAIDKGNFIDVIYLDYALAFDKVSHSKLLVKLTNLGIGGNIHSWISSFLSVRSQRVRLNNQMSDTVKIISGVPQGSVIWPLLFLIYINDLVEVIDKDMSINLFADDTKLSFISNDIDHRYKLQHNIDNFYEWSNSKKSAALTLGNTIKPLYIINNVSIVNCRSYRDLGITFDPSLHFSEHIGVCCTSAYCVINRIFRCFITNNMPAIRKAYISYARPHLEYASESGIRD